MSTLKKVVWPQIILFGDSITQFAFQANGWGCEISHKLERKCDVVNRGLSGYNTRWAKIVLPRIVPISDAPIAAVTVFFGANDCALEDKNPAQHVHLQEFSENLKDIVKYLVSIGVSSDKIIFITPPPLQESAWEKECLLKVPFRCHSELRRMTTNGETPFVVIRRNVSVPYSGNEGYIRNRDVLFVNAEKGSALNRLNSVAGQYAQACVQAAGQSGVDVLDLWTLMQKDGQDFSVYLSDGLHLSDKGNQFVAEHLWTLLERRVTDLPFILPYWGDVDPKCPESSLLCD